MVITKLYPRHLGRDSNHTLSRLSSVFYPRVTQITKSELPKVNPRIIPATRRSSLGERAFLVTATRAWNSLPSAVSAASTLHSFHRALKIHLFTASFLPS